MRYFILITLLALSARAAEEAPESTDPSAPPQGHSMHGEAFNQGPRQSAYRIPKTGRIRFPVSTKNKRARAFFNQGVGQLHGFWYFEAERSFRQVLAIDPDCSMAYWGMAMANGNNAERAAKLIKQTEGKTESLTAREKMYIQGLADFYKDLKADDKKRRKNLVKSYEKIIQQFPDDLEAKAFLVVQLWKNSSKKLEIQSRQVVDAMIQQVLAVNPRHPIHHYRIHLWDYENPSLALDSAAACGPSAPDIAHMWHMPGHLYSRLKRYNDAVYQQEASARVDHRFMMKDRLMPDQIHNYAHNNEWLSRNLGYVGRVRESLALAANMVELPRVPKFATLSEEDKKAGKPAKWDPKRSSWSNGRKRLFADLVRYECWEEVLELDQQGYFDGSTPEERNKRMKLIALAQYQLGRVEAGDQTIAPLSQDIERLKKEKAKKIEEAKAKAKEEKKNEKDTKKAVETAGKAADKPIHNLENIQSELKAYRALALDELDAASIKDIKNLTSERKARLYQAVEDFDEAEKQAREAVKKGAKQVYPLALLASILHQAGKDDEAIKTLNELRDLAPFVDPAWRPIRRLAPVVAKAGYNDDWRKPYEPAADLGERPEPASHGPFRWEPSPAPVWSARGARGKKVGLQDYAGKPVVLIFYLGAGCSHCIDQLGAFAPKTEAFREAGLDLVAISTDAVSGLKETFDQIELEGAFPFPIVSDTKLKIFKAYRAYDNFEKQPLHGTFLIDAQGLVRWQDISFEPFMHPDFVIEEAQRLLKMPASRKVTRVTL